MEKSKDLLTVDYVRENKMSPLDLVSYFRPDWSEDELSYYLWNLTCWPFSLEDVIKQLNEALGGPEDLTNYDI